MTIAELTLDVLEEETDFSYLAQGVPLEEKEKKDIAHLMMSLGRSVNVAEIFTPPRLTVMAQEMGLTGGLVVDLSVKKADGSYWDFNRPADIAEARAIVGHQKPYLLVGSPPCTYGSRLQNWNIGKVDPAKRARQVAEGRKHVNTSCRFYEDQIKMGNYFLHEHPVGNDSWKEKRMRRLQMLRGVYTVRSPMCRFGMSSSDKDGPGLVRKETLWVTNSPAIARRLDGQCSNVTSEDIHRHVYLRNDRAKAAEVYPPELLKTILEGLLEQMQIDGEISAISAGPTCDEPVIEVHDEVEAEELERFIDDVNGGELDAAAVRRARGEEIDYFKKNEVYKKVPSLFVGRSYVAHRHPSGGSTLTKATKSHQMFDADWSRGT